MSQRAGVKSVVIAPLQITVLQLSALLKQADSSKRKLTLTRLASAPVPFTVLSLTGNPCKEDYLAVCGLKVIILVQDYYNEFLKQRIQVTFSPLFAASFSYSKPLECKRTLSLNFLQIFQISVVLEIIFVCF